jgi:hypothetical protein
MLNRAAISVLAIIALSSNALAAIPDATKQPSDKPALNRASPMIDDPLVGTRIHGKAPAGTHPTATDQNVQASLPPGNAKPALIRASPALDDRLMGKHIRSHASAQSIQ